MKSTEFSKKKCLPKDFNLNDKNLATLTMTYRYLSLGLLRHSTIMHT